VVIDLLRRLVPLGVRSVAFSGGEPLLRDDLEAIMLAGRQAGVRSYGLVTNGALVEPLRAHSLRRAGLAIAQVSLDGVDEADHRAVRGCSPADFYRAVRAARLFKAAGVRVDLACLLTPRNLERAPEMVLLAEALGVHTLRYCTFVPSGRARARRIRATYEPAPEAVDRFLAFLRDLATRPDPPLQVVIDHSVGPWDARGRFRCRAGKSVAYVTCEGDLYPCPALLFPPFKVGNVFQTPLEALFTSPAMKGPRNVERSNLAGPCDACTNVACSGGCRGMAWAQTGDAMRTPPYCNVQRRGEGSS
jgi:radical SAM protein with 4Fe4S-binding SPASM domain